MILQTEQAVEDARAALYALDDPGLDDEEIVWIGDKPFSGRPWGEDKEADRRTLRRYVGSVTVAKADPARRKWQPISERVQVRWADGSEPVIPAVAV
jgi:hypothetical protein